MLCVRELVQVIKMVRNLSCISQLKGKKQTASFSGTWLKNEIVTRAEIITYSYLL